MAVRFELKGRGKAIANVSVFQFDVLARVEKQLDESTKTIRNTERKTAPKRSGEYRKRIKRKLNRKELTAQVGPMGSRSGLHFKAHLLERGTEPHPMHPYGNKKVTVQHPGTDAQPHIEPAWASEESNFIRGIEQAVKGARTQ